MSNLRGLIPTAVLAVLLVRSPLRAEEQTPQELPTRDVDISYQITRPQQPTITPRRRWLASERLVRTDGLEKSATIYDRNAHEITSSIPQIVNRRSNFARRMTPQTAPTSSWRVRRAYLWTRKKVGR